MALKKKRRKRPVAKTENNETFLKKSAFMKAYMTTGSVGAAAAATKIDRNRHYRWFQSDEVYRAAFEAVQEDLADSLESEAIRRARDGEKRAVLYKGAPVKQGRRIVYVREYSDTLLLALLKRFKPAAYREQTAVEHSGAIEIVERLQAARRRVIQMQAESEPTTGTAG